MSSEQETPEGDPDELAFTLTWRLKEGYLVGDLDAVNVSNHRVRLTGKPGLVPLGMDSEPLDVRGIVTAELMGPGWVDLELGERARTQVLWSGWDGPASSGEVIIKWGPGAWADKRQTRVAAGGPRQPESRGPATNTTSSWFRKVDQ
jgi:hypothetical protein